MDPKMAAAIRDMHLDNIAYEHPVTLSVLEQAPEGKLGYKPHDKNRPFHELLHHIYSSGAWFASILEDGKVNFGEGPKVEVPGTKAALKAECEKLHDDFVKRMKALSPEKLSAMIPFGEGPAMPAVMYLGWYHHHLIHHRGQLSVYLRGMGGKVPSIYGGSADFPMSM